jgi:hypothetical protein
VIRHSRNCICVIVFVTAKRKDAQPYAICYMLYATSPEILDKFCAHVHLYSIQYLSPPLIRLVQPPMHTPLPRHTITQPLLPTSGGLYTSMTYTSTLLTRSLARNTQHEQTKPYQHTSYVLISICKKPRSRPELGWIGGESDGFAFARVTDVTDVTDVTAE